ncbi:MAG: carboxypeptidase regulatory-like domain-containing protein [Bacteroidales bacterium]|nr:carboxypeptidase regulatory-like domain-containing protein [Bacteroidales bacterium]
MKKIIYSFVIAVIFAITYTSCNKSENVNFQGVSTPTVFNLQTVSGVVIDEFGAPLAGVEVSAHGSLYTTGNNGYFIFENLNVPGNRYILKFEKTGYFNVTKSELVSPGTPAVIDVGMISETAANAVTTTFDASEGGEISIPGFLKVTFPANNFITPSGVTYNGNVNVYAAYLDPSNPLFNTYNFGGDQIGSNHLDVEVFLKAFASMLVELRDDAGNKLNLNPNAKGMAEFELTIPPALEPFAPNEIDIWSFDDDGGVKSMNVASPTGTNSTANKTSGRYQGAVGHFSYIGCELAYGSTSIVQGHVYDGNGQGVGGVMVSVGQVNVMTNEAGFYSAQAASGVQIDVGIFPDYYGTPVSQTVTPFGNTTVNLTVPTLVTVSGQIVDCDGLPIPANILIEWGGSMSLASYTTSGNFAIQMPASPSADISIYGNGTEIGALIYPSGDINLGVIELCPPPTPPPTGPMYATINGGSLPYTNYTITAVTQKYGHYYPSMTYTSGYGLASDNESYISLTFFGGSTGTYVLGSSMTEVYIFDHANGLSLMVENGTLTVTRYDDVWGLIEGFFSGNTPDGESVTGVFSFVRKPDQ